MNCHSPKSASLTGDGFLAVVVSAVVFLIFLPFASAGVDFHHDGIMLKPAMDVLNGQVLHRDTFSQYGPLTTVIHASLLAVFGKKLLVLRIATIAMDAVSLGLLVLWWRTLLPRSLVLCSAGLWLCTAYIFMPLFHLLPWSSSTAMLFQSGCLLSLSTAVRARRPMVRVSAVAIAGVLASAAFWCRQPVGAALAIAGTSIPILLQRRSLPQGARLARIVTHIFLVNPYLLAWCGGGIGLAAVVLGWLYQQGAIADWYQQNVLWPRQFAAGYFSLLNLKNCFFAFHTLVPLCGLVLLTYCVHWICRLSLSKFLKLLITGALAVTWLGVSISLKSLRDHGIVERFIPVAIIGFLGFVAWRRRWRLMELSLQRGLLLPALASWLQFYPVPCPRHLFWGLTPMIGLFVFLLYRTSRHHAQVIALAILIFAVPLGMQTLLQSFRHLQLADTPIADSGLLEGMRPYRSVPMPWWYRSVSSDVTWFLNLRQQLVAAYPDKPVMLLG
ncbi:MAG: hypothetical protein ACKO2P_01880, partial [Planctomycetota bacterium]